jgi:hypothetical protein
MYLLILAGQEAITKDNCDDIDFEMARRGFASIFRIQYNSNRTAPQLLVEQWFDGCWSPVTEKI